MEYPNSFFPTFQQNFNTKKRIIITKHANMMQTSFIIRRTLRPAPFSSQVSEFVLAES